MFVCLTAQDVRWGKSHAQQCHSAGTTTVVTNVNLLAKNDVCDREGFTCYLFPFSFEETPFLQFKINKRFLATEKYELLFLSSILS